MKIKTFLICMFTLVLVFTGCKGNVNSVSGDNTPEVTYENTICPNDDYAEKEEDKVYYTVKVYERGNTFTVEQVLILHFSGRKVTMWLLKKTAATVISPWNGKLFQAVPKVRKMISCGLPI